MQKVINQSVKVYGANWCGDCHRTRFILDTNEIKYEYIDIDKDRKAHDYVVRINPDGFASIPVVVFADGSFLIEPSTSEILKKLNAKPS